MFFVFWSLMWFCDHIIIQGFPIRMVYLCYISCFRYTILVGNPRLLLYCKYFKFIKRVTVRWFPDLSTAPQICWFQALYYACFSLYPFHVSLRFLTNILTLLWQIFFMEECFLCNHEENEGDGQFVLICTPP